MEFVHPFPGKNPGDKLTKQEIISAVRLSLCAEEEATHLYDTIANYVSDEKVKKLMKDVADEEQVHIGEFQKLLKILEEDETEKVGEGEDEADDKLETSKGEEVEESLVKLAELLSEDVNFNNGLLYESEFGPDVLELDKNRLTKIQIANDKENNIIVVKIIKKDGEVFDFTVRNSDSWADISDQIYGFLLDRGFHRDEIINTPTQRVSIDKSLQRTA